MKTRGKVRDPNPGVRPVKRIELKEHNSKKRMIIAVILLALGLALVGYSLIMWLRVEPGWVEITPSEASGETVAGDIVFQFELGHSEYTLAAERKAVTELYTDVCREAYRIFSPSTTYEGLYNLAYVNAHIGEEIKVHPTLYEAFELLEEHGSREIYLAPLLTDYKNLFSCTEDHETAEFDPYQNEAVSDYCRAVADYATDRESVNVELLEDGKVRLTVSDEYLAFAEENGVEHFLDFFMAKNAFAIDYVAQKLIDRGFTAGNLTSYDGFTRNLDTRDLSYSYNLFDRKGEQIYVAARLDYTGASSIVFLRNYSIAERDDTYYMFADAATRHGYIDTSDGLCRSSVENLVCYSSEATCAEVYLSTRPLYVAEEFDSAKAEALEKQLGITSVWFEGTSLRHTGDAKISALYSDENITYTK